jgi:hypothetical protein
MIGPAAGILAADAYLPLVDTSERRSVDDRMRHPARPGARIAASHRDLRRRDPDRIAVT